MCPCVDLVRVGSRGPLEPLNFHTLLEGTSTKTNGLEILTMLLLLDEILRYLSELIVP